MRKKHIAVLISGRGSNFAALLRATLADDFPASVSCVISNKASAPGLEIAGKHNIPSFVVRSSDMERHIHDILCNYNLELICLAGFMKILSEDFISKWPDKIINVHPSLLPAFKGLNAQKQALDAGVKVAGCTVHFVNKDIDSGQIIVQGAVPVMDYDTVETLSDRILMMEHRCLPLAVSRLFTGHVSGSLF